MEIRRAEEADMPRIEELLRQVNLVHHKGRPDLFKYGARKYTDEELRVLIHGRSSWRWTARARCRATPSASFSST